MLMKGKLTAAAAAIVFGLLSASSIAQAGSNKSGRGGFDIGPLGQCFDPPDCGRNPGDRGYRHYRHGYSRYGRYGYAYVPGWRYRHY